MLKLAQTGANSIVRFADVRDLSTEGDPGKPQKCRSTNQKKLEKSEYLATKYSLQVEGDEIKVVCAEDSVVS